MPTSRAPGHDNSSLTRRPHALRPEEKGFELRLPRPGEAPPQDEEWCEVRVGGEWRRVRFHDYDRIYSTPGLYEAIFHGALHCESPHRVVALLREALADDEGSMADLSVLDVGAGNGMVGEELRRAGVRRLIGVDIIPEARAAAERDRPGLYRDYLVADLTDLSPGQRSRLEGTGANALTTVAALGFGDIPPLAFAVAVNAVAEDAWVAFNVKEDFLSRDDPSGFQRLVRRLLDEGVVVMHAWRRYRHRRSVSGDPLHYVAIVARKTRDLSESEMAELRDAE